MIGRSSDRSSHDWRRSRRTWPRHSLHPMGDGHRAPHHIDRCLPPVVGRAGHGHVFQEVGTRRVPAAVGRVIHSTSMTSCRSGRPVEVGRGSLSPGVVDGMFVPLGRGTVDIAGVVRELEANGYRGWYVLEQDISLSGDPEPGGGPQADAIQSMDFLRRLAPSP